MSAAPQFGPELRIGDTERESAVSALGEHFASGRISQDEFEERSSRAFAARTSSELWPLFADLPLLRQDGRPAASHPHPHPHRAGAGHRGWWPGGGVAPLFLVLLAVVLVAELPWPILLLVGWVWWSRTQRRRWRTGAGQTSGSRRAVRGTWS